MITALEQAKQLREQQIALASSSAFPHLSSMEIVQRVLPLASTVPLPPHRHSMSKSREEERERLLSQRAPGYFLLRHAVLLDESMGPTNVDIERMLLELNSADTESETADTETVIVDTAVEMANRIESFWTSIEEQRNHLRRGLALIIHNKETARRPLADYLSRSREGMLVIPNLSWPDSSTVDLAFYPLNDDGAIGYTLMVLLDDNDISERLRQCKFAMCADFFISDGRNKGGPKFGYCSDQCRKLERKKQIADAQRRSRAKKSEKAKRQKERH